MDPAKDEEALYEQLYNELISSGSNKRDRGATDGYVDGQEFKVRGPCMCPPFARLALSRLATAAV